MTASWAQVEALFAAALDTPPEAREALLTARCSDESLRAEVRRLLARHDSLSPSSGAAGGFLGALDRDRAAELLDDIQDPATIGRYEILGRVGRGATGVVYLARDPSLGRRVALKLLAPHLSSRPGAVSRFAEEARTASALDHPHIATIHEIGHTEDGRVFITMAYYEGETLRARIARGPLPVNEAVRLAAQLADALCAAHSKGIVHRDVKPENVVLTTRGARLVDFGIATVTEQDTPGGGVSAGTPPYMSPEQTLGVDVGPHADLWALGVVLYEMLAGVRPFSGESGEVLAAAIRSDLPAPLRPEVPLPVARVVARCLEKSPDRRYASAEALLADLSALATRTGPSRGRRVAIAAGLLTLVSLAVLAARSTLLRPAPPPASVEPVAARTAIAVLQFRNLSTEGTHAYFAGGLHDELVTQLAKVADLKVISRTSVMGYAGSNIPPLRQIASELGVGSVVEGSVQVVGGRLRVNVQLIDAATDAPLWAERYDRTLDDVFAIQSNVAQEIVMAVGAALSSAERRRLAEAPTANAEAYRLYLQGRDYYTRPGRLRQDYETAQGLYERAVALDPEFALAHVALAEIHSLMYVLRYDPSPTRVARTVEEAETALRLAPDLPQAHEAMGMAYARRGDRRRALAAHLKAAQGMPSNARLWQRIGFNHRALGHWDDAIEAFQKAIRLDPRDADLFHMTGVTYDLMHRYADAVRAQDLALSLAPDFHNAALWKGWTYVRWQGRLDTLRAALNRVLQGAPLGSLGDATAQRAAFLLWERNAQDLLELAAEERAPVFQGEFFFLPVSLYAAWAHQVRGVRPAALAASNSARVLLDSVLGVFPDDWRMHAARGLALVDLGERDAALREVRWLEQSPFPRSDAYVGAAVAQDRARILARAGEADAAIDEIARLLAVPSWLTVHTLQLDPSWDPIREHPRFRALLRSSQ